MSNAFNLFLQLLFDIKVIYINVFNSVMIDWVMGVANC